MRRSRRVLIAVALVASTGLIAAPVGAVRAMDSATVPGAPTITAITAVGPSLSVAFTAPDSNGGAQISQYQARCKPQGKGDAKQGNARKSPILVKGVAAGKSYRCVVAARNRAGYGPRSAPFTTTVAGTRCTTASGTVTYTPALPKLASKTLVNDALTLSGTFGDCTGGGVTGGTFAATAPPSKGSNCTTLARDGTTPTAATLTVTWDTHQTSTIALRIQPVKGKPTQPTLIGKVTSGLFEGMRESATIVYRLSAGECTTLDLSTLDFRQLTPLVIA